MKFKINKLGNFKQYWTFWDILKSAFSFLFLWKTVLVVFFAWVIIYYSGFAFQLGKSVIKSISFAWINIVSHAVGDEMKKDELGQINVLLVWYGWETHQWWYLSDTMMIASFNPQLWTVTFLSIPRDLYVKYSGWHYGRINTVFANDYYNSKSLDSAAATLSKKLKDITWIPLDYYALIDFQGFEWLIDKLWWVDVDVPYDLVDSQYPTKDWWYTTFKVTKWMQHLDWETALKYARSRHSTSDFSRALRQQQIIEAIVNNFLKVENITSVDKIKQIYWEYNKIVYTNISFKEMLWMARYIDKPKKFFSYVYSSDCDLRYFSTTNPWCLLYYAPRAWFGGASVILPSWSSPENVEFYKKMRDFAFYVVYNQKFLLENAKIRILNWIDKKSMKKAYKGNVSTVANTLAIDLKKYWFNVEDIGKTQNPYENSLIYINWTWDYSTTLDLLKIFVNAPNQLTGSSDYGNDLTIILWNDYLIK